MGVILLERATLAHYEARLDALRPDSARRWGSLTPIGLLAHLTRTFELTLEELPCKDESIPVLRVLFRFLAYHVLPWPKGKIKVPDYFMGDAAGDFEAERTKVKAALERFCVALEQNPSRKTLHPMFGKLTLRYWRRVHGMHLDHHFNQFGV